MPLKNLQPWGRVDPIDQQKPEDILPKILPPVVFEKDGQKWLQKVSSTPATRLDVQRLAEVRAFEIMKEFCSSIF